MSHTINQNTYQINPSKGPFKSILAEYYHNHYASPNSPENPDDQNAEIFARYLRTQRQKLQITQKELAERAGLPTETIHALEKGLILSTQVSIDMLKKLASALDIDIARLAAMLDRDISIWDHRINTLSVIRSNWAAAVAYIGSPIKTIILLLLIPWLLLSAWLYVEENRDSSTDLIMTYIDWNDSDTGLLPASTTIPQLQLISQKVTNSFATIPWPSLPRPSIEYSDMMIAVLILLGMWFAIYRGDIPRRLVPIAYGQTRKVIYTTFVILIILSNLALLSTSGSPQKKIVQNETDQFSCANVTEIPHIECEALVALYNGTDGPNWSRQDGWLVTVMPCSWYGIKCISGYVAELDLDNENNGNKLSGDIPSAIGNLTTLTYLDLSHNELSSLPAEIVNLNNLTSLDLYANQLSGTIPAELDNDLFMARSSTANRNQVHFNAHGQSTIETMYYLEPGEISDALKLVNGPNSHINVIHFDGCSFGLFESASIVADGLADYVIASPNTGWGLFSYEVYRGLAGLSATPGDYVRSVAQYYADRLTQQSYPYTISVFNMAYNDDIRMSVGELGSALNAYISAQDRVARTEEIRVRRGQVQIYDSDDYEINEQSDFYVDLAGFAEAIGTFPADDTGDIERATSYVTDALAGIVTTGHAQSSDNYRMPWYSTDSSGGGIKLYSNVGQSIVGSSSNSNYKLTSGYGAFFRRDTRPLDNNLGAYWEQVINSAEKALDGGQHVRIDGPGDGNRFVYDLEPDGNDFCPSIRWNLLCGRYEEGVNRWTWTEDVSHPASLYRFMIEAMDAYPHAGSVTLSLIGHSSSWGVDILSGQPRGWGEQADVWPDRPDNPSPFDRSNGFLWDDFVGEGFGNTASLCNSTAECADLANPLPGGLIVPMSTDPICASSTFGRKIQYLSFRDEDILCHNPLMDEWAIYFDASDIVLYTPPASGNGQGAWQHFFTGKNAQLTKGSEDVDALFQLHDGRIVISTVTATPTATQHHTIHYANDQDWSTSTISTTFVSYHIAEGDNQDSPIVPRPAIIVAGRYQATSDLQDKIDQNAMAMYEILTKAGFYDDNIHYLATDSGLPHVGGEATLQELEHSITVWAKERLDQTNVSQIHTLHLVDHGGQDKFYLDCLNQEILTADSLHGWLDQLEEELPDLKVNIVMKSCKIGSFINKIDGNISRPKRVIITSTNNENDAYASRYGAYLSDSFQVSRNSVQPFNSTQQPSLDASGDGIINEKDNSAIAAQRSFIYTNANTSRLFIYDIGDNDLGSSRSYLKTSKTQNRISRVANLGHINDTEAFEWKTLLKAISLNLSMFWIFLIIGHIVTREGKIILAFDSQQKNKRRLVKST